MVDLFAFLLLLVLYLYLNNPSQADYDAEKEKYLQLARQSIELTNNYNLQMLKNRELTDKNRDLYQEIERIMAQNEKKRLERVLLTKKFYKEYNEILKKVEEKKRKAETEGKTIDDPTNLILESAMEWAAELADALARLEQKIAASQADADQAQLRIAEQEKLIADTRAEANQATKYLSEKEKQIAALYSRIDEVNELLTGSGGKFRVAEGSFSGGDFMPKPVDKLAKPDVAERRIEKILDQYKITMNDYPYMFIIGHATQLDTMDAEDKSPEARMERNWVYAARRSATIGRNIIEKMKERGFSQKQMDRLVIVTTGELDLRNPDMPTSQENAWVEVVFGRDWKLPASDRQ